MRTVITPDGRTLAVEQWGVPGGTPVFSLHGSPMSRLARYPDGGVFSDLGIRLITYDRPGFGSSTPHPGRRVRHAAADVAAIADSLRLDRFAVFGVSGGGPHALACAALLPDRVTRAGTLASLAPRDAAGLDWTAGMAELNQVSAHAAARGRDAVAAHITAAGTAGPPVLPEIERAVLARPDIQDMIGRAFTEAVRPGPTGWIDDVSALFGEPWGFDPEEITHPVRLWHGALDTLVPVSHAHWLAARIPSAELTCDPDTGHAGHFDATPAMLRWLVSTEG
ncbi:alpha/beta hydrolase [Longispora sp. K20-0274]|uniref:alpha/beta fold hydrolase n=1 Tax=Longispora sp. K20-0274 TaxID=3088255 RepID=UPI00399BCCD2